MPNEPRFPGMEPEKSPDQRIKDEIRSRLIKNPESFRRTRTNYPEEGTMDNNKLLAEVRELVVFSQFASASMLQRKLRISFATAERLLDTLEEQGVVSPANEEHRRTVLITHTPEEGTTMNQCKDNTCNNEAMEDSQFCEEHRCLGLTAKGNRCKSHVNCGVQHVTTTTTNTNNQKETTVQTTNKDHIVVVSGSRSLQTIPNQNKLIMLWFTHIALRALKTQYGDKLVVWTGMAEGFDKAVAVSCIKLGIRFVAVVPNKTYRDYYWAQHSLTGEDCGAEFDALIEKAEKVIYVVPDGFNPPGEGVYYNMTTKELQWSRKGNTRHLNLVRNDYMAKYGDEFLIWNPSTPGTADMYKTLQERGKKFTILDPTHKTNKES